MYCVRKRRSSESEAPNGGRIMSLLFLGETFFLFFAKSEQNAAEHAIMEMKLTHRHVRFDDEDRTGFVVIISRTNRKVL